MEVKYSKLLFNLILNCYPDQISSQCKNNPKRPNNALYAQLEIIMACTPFMTNHK